MTSCVSHNSHINRNCILTDLVHGNTEFHLFGGLVPRPQATVPGSDLERELLALRRSEGNILDVELNRRIALQVNWRLHGRPVGGVAILQLSLFCGRAVAGRRGRQGGTRVPGQQVAGIASEIFEERCMLGGNA